MTAQKFAYKVHRETNHMYGLVPYEHHLNHAVLIAKRFRYLIPEDVYPILESAVYLHDTIEDCRVTYGQLKDMFGKEVAELVFAVTNEKGRYRHDRENNAYFEGIRNTSCAIFVKLCDRIANVENSIISNHGMYERYKAEHATFVNNLFNAMYKDMFYYLDDLIKDFVK